MWPGRGGNGRPDPVANTSPEAVALRKAAIAFANHEVDESDPHDRKGFALNGALLLAAEKYGRVARSRTTGGR